MPETQFRIEHPQGLGDAVALSVILRHLRHYHPRAHVKVIVLPGREGLYSPDLADEVTSVRDLKNPPTHLLQWPFANRSYKNHPSTYAERCLFDSFSLQPIEELCGYRLAQPADADRQVMRDWLRSTFPQGRIALFHHFGNAAAAKKNPDDYEAAGIAGSLAAAGYHVLVWDANRASPLPEANLGTRVPVSLVRRRQTREPGESSIPLDVTLMMALIAEVDLFCGVDSGPLHLSAGLDTPSIGIWKKLSPLHCIAPADNLHHVCLMNNVAEYERYLIHRPIDDGVAYLRANYSVTWCGELQAGVAQVLRRETAA